MSFNIEWMNDLFEADKPVLKASHKKGRYTGPSIENVPVLCSRIQRTIQAMDPDIMGVVEGPKNQSQMEKFVADFLTDPAGNPLYAVVPSPTARAQRPHLLVKRSLGAVVRTLEDEQRYKAMVKSWKFNLWGTYSLEKGETHTFFRRPLVAELTIGSRKLTVVLLHIKSKHIGLDPKPWVPYVEAAILARQKITSEIQRVRQYLDDALTEEITRSVVVMGDLNDGPGRDMFEARFMLHNLVDVIQGTVLDPELNVYHALEALRTRAFTAEFTDPIDGGRKFELIDHILVSPGMLEGTADFQLQKGSGKVEHDAWEGNLGANPETERDDRPSDHRPVSCEITQT